MSTISLIPPADGDLIKVTDITDLQSALKNDVVGRDTNGDPSDQERCGTAQYPWLEVNTQALIIDGRNIDLAHLSRKNKIISAKTVSGSNRPDFLRASGSTNSVTLLASVGDPFRAYINGTYVEVTANVVKTGLTLGPTANHTATISDASMSSRVPPLTLISGEDLDRLRLISVGSQVQGKIGSIAAFKGYNSELLYGPITGDITTTYFGGSAHRGHFFDSTGTPIQRQSLIHVDVLTLMSLGWIFLQDNGATIDVSYKPPLYGGSTPTVDMQGSALTDGQYWFDTKNDVWLRYDSVSSTFQVLNRMLIGMCVMDNTACIGTRSEEFDRFYSQTNTTSYISYNNADIYLTTNRAEVNVYGRVIQLGHSFKFNKTDHLEFGTLSTATRYYLYITDDGDPKVSTIIPHSIEKLQGLYHPYNSWRAVGEFYHDSSSRIVALTSYRTRVKLFEDYLMEPIGSWDMNTTASKNVYFNRFRHSHNVSNVTVIVFQDDRQDISRVTRGWDSSDFGNQGTESIVGFGAATGNLVTLYRKATGLFGTSVNYNDASINRGYVIYEFGRFANYY